MAAQVRISGRQICTTFQHTGWSLTRAHSQHRIESDELTASCCFDVLPRYTECSSHHTEAELGLSSFNYTVSIVETLFSHTISFASSTSMVAIKEIFLSPDWLTILHNSRDSKVLERPLTDELSLLIGQLSCLSHVTVERSLLIG